MEAPMQEIPKPAVDAWPTGSSKQHEHPDNVCPAKMDYLSHDLRPGVG